MAKAPLAPPAAAEELPAGESERPEEEEEEEDDRDLMGDLEKELLEAVVLPRELKEELKTDMEKEFDNIINKVGGWGPPLPPPP